MSVDGFGIHRHRFLWVLLDDKVWLPKRLNIRYDARLALLKHQAGEVEETKYNFKKFQADSRIISVTER